MSSTQSSFHCRPPLTHRPREIAYATEPVAPTAPDAAVTGDTLLKIQQAFRQLPPKLQAAATLALIYPPGIGVLVPGERWDSRAQPMLDYFSTFEESFNRFPGFNYEVQGVYQEQVNGRIKFHTYVVRQ